MNVIFKIKNHEAIPVRAIPLVTAWCVTPQTLALELSKRERGFTAYAYAENRAIPVKLEAWGMMHDVLTDIVRKFKNNEAYPDEHRQSAWRESLKQLPAGVFVWFNEFEAWYGSTYYTPDSVWEEQHRVVGEDDDPEPLFHLKQPTNALDLFPIAIGDCEQLICEGFEPYFETAVDAPATATPAPVVAGKKWTPEKLAELKAYREAHTMPETAERFGISGARIRELLPSEKPKAKPFAGLIHRI